MPRANPPPKAKPIRRLPGLATRPDLIHSPVLRHQRGAGLTTTPFIVLPPLGHVLCLIRAPTISSSQISYRRILLPDLRPSNLSYFTRRTARTVGYSTDQARPGPA